MGLAGGQQQGMGQQAPMQAQGGTGFSGQSPMNGMGQGGDGSGLLTLLTAVISAMQGGGPQGGLLSALMNPGQAAFGGQGQSSLPRAQGSTGDVQGTIASMNPTNYMGQQQGVGNGLHASTIYSLGPSEVDL